MGKIVDLRGYSLLHTLYLYIVSRRPAKSKSIVVEAADLDSLRSTRYLQLRFLPDPATWIERLLHRKVSTHLQKEIVNLDVLDNLGVVMVGQIRNGGDATQDEE